MLKQIPIKEYNLKIIKIMDESSDVKTFRLGIPDGAKIPFFPGQFFMVCFEDNPSLHRAYSIASSTEQKKYVDITMNLVAEFTKRLWSAKVGDSLIFKGPYGKFYFSEEIKSNLVLIGGGLGITPLMSILRTCTDKKLKNKIDLIYSVRSPADIIYHKEIQEQKKINRSLDYLITITRTLPEHKWNQKTGRIDAGLLKEKIKDIGGSLYFLCGHIDFVKSIIAMLEGLGVKKEQIKTDIW